MFLTVHLPTHYHGNPLCAFTGAKITTAGGIHTAAFRPLQQYVSLLIPFPLMLAVVGDYAGRTYLPAFRPLLIASHIGVLLLSLSRTLFIPLFLLCNVVPRPADSLHPLINSDTAYFLILLAFGLSNGFVSPLNHIR